jgi:hypothetical protein
MERGRKPDITLAEIKIKADFKFYRPALFGEAVGEPNLSHTELHAELVACNG